MRPAAEQALCDATGATRVVRLCGRCGSAGHGQPRLVGASGLPGSISVSISYAGDLAAVAWGTGPVGIDLETTGPSVSGGTGLIDRPEWTRIEALLKATGRGLTRWPDDSLPDLPVTALELPDGYVGTLAGTAAWRLVTVESALLDRR